jgi:alcohol dehydrogenase (cytochrome c)
LYTDSVLALDPRTGGIKWSFQFTPHDEWDYDGVNENVLADITRGGRRVHALLHADRNGNFVVLDRTNGRFIYSEPLVKTTAVLGYDRTGKAVVDPAARAAAGRPGSVCPSAIGGTNWWPPTYDAQTGLFYVPLAHMCMTVTQTDLIEVNGAPYLGEDLKLFNEPQHPDIGEFLALDPATGKRRWSFSTATPWCGGAVSTAGGLVFSGTADQRMIAFDAASGRVAWSYPLSSGVAGVPVTYRVDGKQYVAVFAGWGGGVALFGGPAADITKDVPRGGELYVFALP